MDIDDSEVYAAMSVGPNAAPQRRYRLRLRKLDKDERGAAGKLVERMDARLLAEITDVDEWEGFITQILFTIK